MDRKTPWHILSRFPCLGKELVICRVILKSDGLAPLPAYHSDLPICWVVTEGEGFVLYDEMNADWVLAPVIPGSKFAPQLGECFAFFPHTAEGLEFELGCQESQLNGRDLDYMGALPKSAKVYLTGTVTRVTEDGVVLTEGDVSTLVKASEEEKRQLVIGERDSLPWTVEIAHFLEAVRSSGRSALMSPVAGDEHWSSKMPDTDDNLLPEPLEEVPPAPIRAATPDHSLTYTCPRARRYIDERNKRK